MSFNKSLRYGKAGEALYYACHAGKLEKLDGLQSDFRCTTTGQGIELKTDFYDYDKSGNFFFERYSDKAKGSPGGPWQAQKHSQRLVYLFPCNLVYFEFDLSQLVPRLEEVIPSIKPFEVSNSGWTTVGYKVPHTAVADLTKPVYLKVQAA